MLNHVIHEIFFQTTKAWVTATNISNTTRLCFYLGVIVIHVAAIDISVIVIIIIIDTYRYVEFIVPKCVTRYTNIKGNRGDIIVIKCVHFFVCGVNIYICNCRFKPVFVYWRAVAAGAKQYKPKTLLLYTHTTFILLFIMDICIRDLNTREWTSSRRSIPPAMRDTYAQYKERPHYYRETPYLTPEYIVYRPNNDPYLPTYIARVEDIPALNDGTGIGAGIGVGQRNNLANNITITSAIHERMESIGHAIPIMDLNDVYVFITDPAVVGGGRANWFHAREYQTWAYLDFMYDRNKSIKKSYVSRNTPTNAYISDGRILANQIVTLPDLNIDTHIIFNISRNENGSVYLERNNTGGGTRTRICDNEYARTGYLGFYTRITMDPGIVVIPPPPPPHGLAPPALLSIAHISALEETDDDDVEDQCIMCVRYRINTRFSPCEHTVCCSECYLKFSKNECPVCRAVITRVMNI
jgi:hypothetical protein